METKVGIRELKNQLSQYVRRAEAGDVIHVTDRGRVVAELLPPGSTRRHDIHPVLLEMERKGLIRPGAGRNGPDLYPKMPQMDLGGETVQDIIDFLRGDR